MYAKAILLGSLFLFANASLYCQVKKGIPDVATIKEWMIEYKVPIVAIGVIENGRVGAIKLFSTEGVSYTGKRYVFNVASLTKPVVAMATLRLVSQGKWNLDEPLYHYWIDPDIANDPRHKFLTTRYILSQRSGFANWRWMNSSKKLAFEAAPGEKFGYSGEGYEYLRKALEAKFKMPLDQLVASVLLDPFGLKATRFFWDQTINEESFVVGHDSTGKAYDIYKNSQANAANWLLTTIEDYAGFSAEVINNTLLSPALFGEMVKPQTIVNKNAQLFWGLGWGLVSGLKNNSYALIHGGGGQGVACIVVLLPKSKQGIVVLTNSDNGQKVYEKILIESLESGKEIVSRMAM